METKFLEILTRRSQLISSKNTTKLLAGLVFAFFEKFIYVKFRSSHCSCSVKKGALKNLLKFPGKHLCQSLLFNKVASLKTCNFIKKETMAQVFSCEFGEISKDVFFTENFLATASTSGTNI